MLKIDRMEFPKKYPIPNWMKLSIVLFGILAIMLHNCSQDNLDKEIRISDVKISEYSRVHVEVTYKLQNLTRVDREVWLLLKVFDAEAELLTSTLFMVKIKAGKTQSRIKIMDDLIRPLENNEPPAKATIEIYKRKVLS